MHGLLNVKFGLKTFDNADIRPEMEVMEAVGSSGTLVNTRRA